MLYLLNIYFGPSELKYSVVVAAISISWFWCDGKSKEDMPTESIVVPTAKVKEGSVPKPVMLVGSGVTICVCAANIASSATCFVAKEFIIPTIATKSSWIWFKKTSSNCLFAFNFYNNVI